MYKKILLRDYFREIEAVKEASADELFTIRGGVVEFDGKEMLDRIKFANYLQQTFCAVYIGGSIAFYNWNRHLYEFLDSKIYLGLFKMLLDEISTKLWKPTIEAEIKQRFERDLGTKLKEFIMPKDYIVFNNGVYQLSTGDFFEGDHPELVINTCCTGYEYDEDSECPRFLEFLDDVFNGDEELIDVVQEMMGYTLLYGENPLQSIVLLVGGGRNGKGVLTNICQKVHGIENCSGTSVTQLSSKFGVSQLYDKVLNIASENDENVVTDTSILKTISGNDIVMVEKKYKDAIPTRIFCKLWISTNDIKFRDTSKGFEERLIPIPFTNTYVDNPLPNTNQRKRVNNLEDDLEEELPGIFNWMLDGLIRLSENDWVITTSDAVLEERKKLVEDSNPVLMFVDDCIIKQSKSKLKRPSVYEAFQDWVQYNNIIIGGGISRKKFYKKLYGVFESKGISISIKKIRGERFFEGICFKQTFNNSIQGAKGADN